LLKQILAYGLPLTGISAMNFIINASDRFLISYFLGNSEVGLYAVSYDLADRSLFVLMISINLAALPLVVRAFEQQGEEAAREQMKKNLSGLLGLSFPAAVGFILCSGSIVYVLLGAEYRAAATTLLPPIVVAKFLAGMVNSYFAIAFHLSKDTLRLVYVYGATASLRVGLNCVLLPTMGLVGAAYAAAGAYGLEIILCYLLGRKLFPVPLPWREPLKIAVATAVMCLALWPLLHLRGGSFLALQVGVGMVVYALAAVALNVSGFRTRLLTRFRRKGHEPKSAA